MIFSRKKCIFDCMKIAIDIPDTLASHPTGQRYFEEALVAILYQTGDLSSKEGCVILQMPRREFEEMLSRFVVSILPDDDLSIALELNA